MIENTTGTGLISLERVHIAENHNITASQLLDFPKGSLAVAGACYALAGTHQVRHGDSCMAGSEPPPLWPFPKEDWAPAATAAATLAMAGALLAAEIDRIAIEGSKPKNIITLDQA